MYIRACGKEQNWSAITGCVRRKYRKEDEQHNVNATDEIIHLRLGDVLDDEDRRKIPLANYLRDWVEWWPNSGFYYVPPLAAYTNLKIPKNITRVTLMGNPYYGVGENCSNSLAYVAAVKRALQRLHPRLDIAVRFPPPPGSQMRHTLGEAELADRDLHFVQSRAAVFVASRGGFSHLLADIALTAGHQVDWSVRSNGTVTKLTLATGHKENWKLRGHCKPANAGHAILLFAVSAVVAQPHFGL